MGQESMNRQQRRVLRFEGRPRPSRTRTGRPAHFQQWMAAGVEKSALQRLKLNKLADAADHLDGEAASGYALLFVGGIKNVWDLKRANDSALWVRGVELRQLEAVHADLVSRGVTPDWSVE